MKLQGGYVRAIRWMWSNTVQPSLVMCLLVPLACLGLICSSRVKWRNHNGPLLTTLQLVRCNSVNDIPDRYKSWNSIKMPSDDLTFYAQWLTLLLSITDAPCTLQKCFWTFPTVYFTAVTTQETSTNIRITCCIHAMVFSWGEKLILKMGTLLSG